MIPYRITAALALSIVSMCCATKPLIRSANKPGIPQRPVVNCTQAWQFYAAPDDHRFAIPCTQVAEAEKRNVWLFSFAPNRDDRYCSGVIIQTGLVLTAGHCLGATMTVDGEPATVAKSSGSNDDLMLLKTKTAEFSPLAINASPTIGEAVYFVGNHEPRMGIFSMGRISWLDDMEICASTIVAPGLSGGAIYDSSGQLVTITQQAQFARFDAVTASALFSIGVHPKRIAAFLKGIS